MKEVLRFIKFGLFSASAGLIEIGSFAIFNEFCGTPYWFSYLVALVLSILWNFTLNRKFTFKSSGNLGRAMLLVALYYAVFTPLSTLLEHHLASTVGWNEYFVTGINMILNFVTEFLFQRFIVYGKTVDNASAR